MCPAARVEQFTRKTACTASGFTAANFCAGRGTPVELDDSVQRVCVCRCTGSFVGARCQASTTTPVVTATPTPTPVATVSGFTCLKDFPAFEVDNEVDKGDGSTHTQESCDGHTATVNEVLATCAGDLPCYELDCDDKRDFGTNILIKCVATCPPSPVCGRAHDPPVLRA